MTKKGSELSVPVSEEKLALLRSEFPMESGFQRAVLPRIAFKAQDVTEEVKNAKTGKKEIKILIEAGTFTEERPGEDEDEDTGKKVWTKDELGDEFEGIIMFERKQLRYYDEGTETFTSSPIYDSEEEVVPLFCDKAEVERGTPAELKAKYPGGKTRKGKPKSLLEDNRILYVLKDGANGCEVFQLNLRGSSMYSYMEYKRTVRPAVPAVLTVFNSAAQDNGSVSWNQMTFEAVRNLSSSEVDEVIGHVQDLKEAIAAEKSFYASQSTDVDPLAAEFNKR